MNKRMIKISAIAMMLLGRYISVENDFYYRIRECIVRDKDAVYEEVNPYTGDSSLYFWYEFELDDLVKLGDTKVTFDPKQTHIKYTLFPNPKGIPM